jgi:hypothetical protein
MCLFSGVNISGVNAEVMPAQWEYQVGAAADLGVLYVCGHFTWMCVCVVTVFVICTLKNCPAGSSLLLLLFVMCGVAVVFYACAADVQLKMCLCAGVNAKLMLAQWEYQMGPAAD